MNLLLVGKMTGLENFGVEIFEREKKKLLAMGHTVISPADELRPYTKREVVEVFLKNSALCDGIVLLDNWETSEGASCEVVLAVYMEIPIFRLVQNMLIKEDFNLLDLIHHNRRFSPLYRAKGWSGASYGWKTEEKDCRHDSP